MINLGSSLFEANNIFLQPSYFCSKSCSGCYMHERGNRFGRYQMDLIIWEELINDILVDQNFIKTGQVTFALDSLPMEESKSNERSTMLTLADYYRQALWHRKVDMEAHITVNTVSDLLDYHNAFGDIFRNLSLLSVSYLNTVKDIELARQFAPGAKINWNVMSGVFAGKSLNNIKDILSKVDSAYVLLHKSPMGLPGNDIGNFISSLEIIQQLKSPKEEIPNACPVPDLTSKINLDGCMNDAIKFKKTGQGCSSNISRFQIWPNGHVTGCAYNSENLYDREIVRNLQDVLFNLKQARTRYEFNSCSIPKELKLFNSRKQLKVVDV